MPQIFPEIDCRAPLCPDFEQIFAARAFAPFSPEAISLLQSLSARLLQEAEAKQYPDVIAFAFWCRAGALRSMQEKFTGQQLRLGRGVVFHISPSNVPMNFAYSFAAGLLAGNANVVRTPSRDFRQVEIICSALRDLLEQDEFKQLHNHITLLRYEKNSAITDFFSGHCDVRIIWGGDRTIEDVRRSPLPARSFDLTFADRYSLCVINAANYPGDNDPARIALDFYNDTYLLDQNACTAPHLVVWLGSAANIKKAQELFWHSLHQVVAAKYELSAFAALDKLADTYRFAASCGECSIATMGDNLLVRIEVVQLDPALAEARSRCGVFYEYAAKSLDDTIPLLNSKVQTLAYYGLDRAVLQQFMEENRPKGIDRIVPLGRTLEFSLVWDGYDLISMLSRIVSFDPQ